MSFIKIERIDPTTISNPDPGHIYIGQDLSNGFGGFWQKDEWGNIFYIASGNTYITVNNITGTTYIITGSTSSGISGSSGKDGTSGTSGKSGISGTSGSSGSSGISGSSGSSGKGSSGSSGSSGYTGSSGTSGLSGSSGVDGVFFGSSGTSGWSGYGAATRIWTFTGNTIPSDGYFYGVGSGGYDLGLLTEIRLNKKDLDSVNLINWLTSWDVGIVKIENVNNLANSAIYQLTTTPYIIGNVVVMSGLTAYNSGFSLVEGDRYFISYIPAGFGNDGSSGSSGISGSSGVSPCQISFVPNSGIEYVSGTTCQVETIYNTLLDPSLIVPLTIGGILSGTSAGSLSGLTLVGIIDDLLFPTINPTYTIPSIVLNSSITGITEIGSTISPILTLVGTKNDASGFTYMNIIRNSTVISSTLLPVLSSCTDIESQFGFVDPNNPNSKYIFTYTDSSYVIPSTVTSLPSLTVYGGLGDYGSGLPKEDNKGVLDSRTFLVRNVDAPQSGSTTIPSSITISGYYPYYFGVSGSSMTADQIVDLIQSGSGFTSCVDTVDSSVNMLFNAVGQWPWFVIFSGFTNRTKWSEVGYPLNTGDIGTSLTDLFSAPFYRSINSPNGYWSDVYFKIYVSQKVTTISNCTIT